MLHKMLDSFRPIISTYFLKKKNCCDVKSFFEILFMEPSRSRCDYLPELLSRSTFTGHLPIHDVGISCDHLPEDLRTLCGRTLHQPSLRSHAHKARCSPTLLFFKILEAYCCQKNVDVEIHPCSEKDILENNMHRNVLDTIVHDGSR